MRSNLAMKKPMNKTTGWYNIEKESKMAQRMNNPALNKTHEGVLDWKNAEVQESISLDNLLNICPLGIVSWNKLIGALTNLIITPLWKYLPNLIIPTVNKYILQISKTHWIN